jgi:lipid A ethanolaminephosphotransferase
MVGMALTIVGASLLYPAVRIADDVRVMRSELFPINVMYNFGLAIKNRFAEKNYEESSATFNHEAYRTKSLNQREIYLFVIGESSRAANWELYGYERATNPRLRNRTDVHLFRNVVTQSNTTHKSVPMLLSSVEASNFSDIFSRKGLADMFKQVGFYTCFLSTQSPQGAMVDNFARECNRSIYIGAPKLDLQLVQVVKNVVEEAPDQDLLLIIHSYGSHYRYNQRYSRDLAYYTPDEDVAVNGRNIESLRNAYDNSIVYTDCLLDSLASVLDSTAACAAMLYCSDHGEDLFDDERGMFLHSSSRVTYYQLHIPSLVWFSNGYRDYYPDKVAMAQTHRWSAASTNAMFHTMADIASIRSPYVDIRKSLVSPAFDSSSPRLYLNDRNEAVLIGHRIGLTDLDRREFLLHGVQCSTDDIDH